MSPNPRWRRRLIMLVDVVVVLLVWEFAVNAARWVDPVLVPAPSGVLLGGVGLVRSGTLAYHAIYSAQNFATGYAFALVGGVGGGLVIGSSPVLDRLLAPVAWSLYAVPIIAILPLTTIWLGFGPAPVIFIVFLSAFLPMLLNTIDGIRTVDPSLIRAAQVFGAGRVSLWLKVVLPATVPFVLTGMRLAIISAVIGLFVAEAEGGPRGIGSIVAVSSSRFLVNEAFAAVMILGFSSIVLVHLVGFFEGRVSSWRASANA